MDLLVPLLARLTSIYDAGQLFLNICIALFVLGTMAIHAALYRHLSPWLAASLLLPCGYVFNLGFVNYLHPAWSPPDPGRHRRWR